MNNTTREISQSRKDFCAARSSDKVPGQEWRKNTNARAWLLICRRVCARAPARTQEKKGIIRATPVNRPQLYIVQEEVCRTARGLWTNGFPG